MACPYFEPGPLAPGPKPARTPLGELYDGLCHATAIPSAVNDPHTVRELCNFGYGRGRCAHFPQDAPYDAVRFTRLGSRWIWILEREYSPREFGNLEHPAPAAVERLAVVLDRAGQTRIASA